MRSTSVRATTHAPCDCAICASSARPSTVQANLHVLTRCRDEQATRSGEVGLGDGSPPGHGAAAPARVNLPGKHEWRIKLWSEPGERRDVRVGPECVIDVELALDPCLLCAGADLPCVSVAAEQERDRGREQRLARTRLAGDCRETRAWFERGALHDDEVLDLDPNDHSSTPSLGSIGVIARSLARTRGP